MCMSAVQWLVGIDIGGTFTDIVAMECASGELRAAKVPSRRDGPVAAIDDGLSAVGIQAQDVVNLIHGTTRVTNAIVEETLPPVALIATEGFEDTLAIARLRRRELYRLDVPPRRPPLVPANRIFGVRERLAHDGAVLEILDADSLEQAIAQARASGCESIAVSLLHAYANPRHELEVGEALGREFRHVSLSHEINPEAREYERTSSTVLNAATMPVAVEYLDELIEKLELKDRLQLFHSAGGWATPRDVQRRPLIMALSGPAAGVTASARLSRWIDRSNLLTFDMGGTTTDVCLIVDGEAEVTDAREIGDRPLRQPMLAVTSIGAGGGSIVRLTPGGLLVGPESAGAEPGPACYARGGTEPTVTDANLLLGYLSPGHRLGAESSETGQNAIELDVELAESAIRPVAETLGKSAIETALGIVQIANANMARALRRVTVERGVDGRQCTLLAFGGAGPMHAVGLAEAFGVSEVVVPIHSSGFSAYGCLLSDMAYAQQRTVRLAEGDWDERRFLAILDELFNDSAGPLAEVGLEADDLRVERVALMRYEAQSDAVPVPFGLPMDVERLGEDFVAQHRQLYGFATEEPWIIEGLRVRVSAPAGVEIQRRERPHSERARSVSECWFDAAQPVATPRWERDSLGTDQTLSGPVIVEDAWSTVLIPPGWQCRVDVYGNLFLTRVESS
jgi:N-methylhydantoinase A